jgi:hypothetical protein
MTRESPIRAALSVLGSLALALALALVLTWGGVAAAQSRMGRPGGGGHARQGAPVGHEDAYAPRREPGPGYFGGPPPYGAGPYQPPRYAAPPPSRPQGAAPGWRPAPRAPPGLYRAYGPYRSPTASLGWVIESIGRRSPGRVLDARVEDRAGRPVYRVLWLTSHGRRIDYIVDAETGAVLGGG